MIGTLVSHYRIESRLGKGGMGVVYKVYDTRLDRYAAIKFIAADQEGPSLSSRFEREARAASRLNHPNIATIYDVGTHEGRPFIVMEYLEGKTLAEGLGGRPLPPDETVNVALQVARGLAAAHAGGIVHRDIKPANIFITTSGQVKILDFGVAKRCAVEGDEEATTELTHLGGMVGTIAYMSPEQILGEAVDPRSDLFSLGVVLFEMATGQRPFQGKNSASTIDSILHKDPGCLEDLQVKVPGPLESVLARLLAKSPEQRYSSAEELISDLESPAAAVPGHPVRGGWISPRRILWASLLLILALFTASALWFVLPLWRSYVEAPTRTASDERPIVAVLPLVNVSGGENLNTISLGIAHSLVTSLSMIHSLTMISASATLGNDMQNQKASDVARKLGATCVVTGSVQQSGNRLHVTLNLVRSDDSVIWGGELDGTLNHLFDLQKNLSVQLSQALQLILTASEGRRLATPPTLNNRAYQEYTAGRALLERLDVEGNVDRAIQLFESALKRDPRFAQAQAGLGESFWARFKSSSNPEWAVKARKAVERAVQLDPEDPTVRYTLALIYRGTGRADAAIQELHKVLALQPNNDDAHQLLGEILSDRGRVDEAVKELRQAINLRPNFWGHYKALGLAYLDAARYGEAVEVFRKVTEIQPDSSWGYQLLGVSYHLQGNLEEAAKNYEKAILLGPSAASYSNLGTILYRQGKFGQAAEKYEKAIELKPGSPATHRNLGDAYSKLGRAREARHAYEKAVVLLMNQLRVNPRDPRVAGMLAVCEAKLGRSKEALRHVSDAVSEAPDDAQVLYRKAVVNALLGNSDDAISSLKVALAHGYSASEIEKDDDLNSLKTLPAYRRLMAGQN